MSRRTRHFGALAGTALAALLAAGCASSSSDRGNFAPAPVSATPPSEYVIQSGDVLALKFYYHPDHDQEATVRPDGKVLLPLVGEVRAAGVTPVVLAEELVRRYSANLRDPKIAVSIKQMNENRVYVGGEVGKPGFVTYRPGLTALQALLDAGGPKDSAYMEEVVILQKVADQQYRAAKINLTQMLEEGKTAVDVGLNPADVVFVPKTRIAKFNQWVDEYLVKSLPFRIVAPIPF